MAEAQGNKYFPFTWQGMKTEYEPSGDAAEDLSVDRAMKCLSTPACYDICFVHNTVLPYQNVIIYHLTMHCTEW